MSSDEYIAAWFRRMWPWLLGSSTLIFIASFYTKPWQYTLSPFDTQGNPDPLYPTFWGMELLYAVFAVMLCFLAYLLVVITIPWMIRENYRSFLYWLFKKHVWNSMRFDLESRRVPPFFQYYRKKGLLKKHKTFYRTIYNYLKEWNNWKRCVLANRNRLKATDVPDYMVNDYVIGRIVRKMVLANLLETYTDPLPKKVFQPFRGYCSVLTTPNNRLSAYEKCPQHVEHVPEGKALCEIRAQYLKTFDLYKEHFQEEEDLNRLLAGRIFKEFICRKRIRIKPKYVDMFRPYFEELGEFIL